MRIASIAGIKSRRDVKRRLQTIVRGMKRDMDYNRRMPEALRSMDVQLRQWHSQPSFILSFALEQHTGQGRKGIFHPSGLHRLVRAGLTLSQENRTGRGNALLGRARPLQNARELRIEA